MQWNYLVLYKLLIAGSGKTKQPLYFPWQARPEGFSSLIRRACIQAHTLFLYNEEKDWFQISVPRTLFSTLFALKQATEDGRNLRWKGHCSLSYSLPLFVLGKLRHRADNWLAQGHRIFIFKRGAFHI